MEKNNLQKKFLEHINGKFSWIYKFNSNFGPYILTCKFEVKNLFKYIQFQT